MATSSPSASSSSTHARSCHGCNQRKVRCDRCEPCGACTRTGRPCVFPAAGPRKRRTKQSIMADMASRLSSLERSLARPHSAPLSPSSRSSRTSRTARPAMVPRGAGSPERPDVDVVIGQDSSSQYFNEVFLSRVMDQQDMQAVLADDIQKGPPPPLSPYTALGLLAVPSAAHPPASFHPRQAVAVRLWAVFRENVEGCCSSKVLHHPTDGVRIYAAIDSPTTAPLDVLALCYAVYFAAMVSLDEADVRGLGGGRERDGDKQAQLFGFKAGLEQSLAHGDFLDRPSVTGLTALTIYLTALRTHNRGKSIWILHGLALRIAQSLGLHRDGLHLAIPPFQAEIRRRLWWHLLSRYGRAGEDYGLENTDSLLTRSTVQLPLNIEDADLQPDMRAPPPERDVCTPMTLTLVTIELAVSAQRLTGGVIAAASGEPTAEPGNDPGNDHGNGHDESADALAEDTRLRCVQEVRARIERLTRGCNPVVPQHRMTLLCSRFLVRKFDFVTRLQWALLRQQRTAAQHHMTAPSARLDFATDENLVDALDILQPRLFSEDDMLQQYASARRAFPQYYMLMYILWHLCVKPVGPHVARAWTVVGSAFAAELLDNATVGYGPKTTVLVALRAKAAALRARLGGDDADAARMPAIEDPVVAAAAAAAAAGDAVPLPAASSGESGGLGLPGDLGVQDGLSYYLLGDMNSELVDFDMGNFVWPGLDG